jgi:outer membrane protein OmpA-like peptidoglycan-associated protein
MCRTKYSATLTMITLRSNIVRFKLTTVFLIVISPFHQFISGQTETYTVNKTFFSSDKYDEYSPVYYKNGIVFCSNRNVSLSSHSTSQNKGLFKIYYIDTTTLSDWQHAKLFSKNLTTPLNDGPVTFNRTLDTIYYSRNQKDAGKLSDISNSINKLGIFSAVMVAGQWSKIRDLRINADWYNVTTPCLSPDSKRLYFASDRPGGFGGSDLYYSEWKNNRWNDPVNLGAGINTGGNEAYPFINPDGDLFFSSDGHKGFGGKDIYFSQHSDTTWLTPVHLDAPVNTEFDDFGIITDSLMNSGYFSSNREKTIDIFHFRTNNPHNFYNTIQMVNQYCFTFRDSGELAIDTLKLRYEWDFKDKKKSSGLKVNHCFPGPGNYYVELNIVEKATGNIFFQKLAYNLELKDFEQPYINSEDIVVKGDAIDFDAVKTYLPGYRILSYSWDFGDGSRATDAKVKHTFSASGEYLVNLSLTLKSNIQGYTSRKGSSKKILVLNNPNDKSSYLNKNPLNNAVLPDVRKYSNAYIKPVFSSEAELKKEVVFQVELVSSKTKIDPKSSVFRNVPKKYDVKEVYNEDTELYSYVVDQEMSLMATYPAYKELSNLGFKNARIRLTVLKDPAAKALFNLIRIYGVSADTYFDQSDFLTSNGLIMLDQIVKLMERYPSAKLQIGVHTDSTLSPETGLSLSQKRAQILVNYLINKGVSVKRLTATGFAATRPIAPNFLEKDRKLNRRIDFIIVN